jgi:hypothetical protein
MIKGRRNQEADAQEHSRKCSTLQGLADRRHFTEEILEDGLKSEPE